MRISDLLRAEAPQQALELCAWVRTKRDAKGFSFIELNDGSCLANIQVIATANPDNPTAFRHVTTGAAVRVRGELVESPGKGQQWEIQASSVEVIGAAPDDYPLQKKRHSDEFLRTIAHLRPRTNKYGAMLRLRSRLSHAIHTFFQERGFHWIHTPIITGADCEGAGELFRVTALDLHDLPKQAGKIDFSRDFFGKEANLTVSGQLEVETCCLSLGRVYTFGPTFRAENSNTSRHAAEFWMIEPELAFADLQDDMDLGEALIRYLVNFVREQCSADLDLFCRFVDKSLPARLDNIAAHDFVRIPYAEAVSILQQSGQNFAFKPEWGKDLQSEHERFLTEQYCKRPVIVFDYPKDIKAFYMRQNDDGKTVAAMDILAPSIGELIGGSQREERYEQLRRRIAERGFDPDDYWWYLDTRKYGTAPHCGFGLGFERLLMLLTGITNIRDVLPFPRTPNHLEF